MRDFDITGMSLLDAFQSICRKAGSYDIGVDYQDNGVSELKIIDESAKANTGYRLVTPDYASGIGECVNSVSVIKSGHVRESFINGFDSTAIIGDAPAVEVFVTMPAEVTNGFPVGLEAAWSDEDEIAFRNYVARYGTSYDGNQTSLRGTQYSFAAACKKWPLVYCAYRIKGSFNPFEGTKWNGYKNGGYPRIKPFQLTGYQQNQSNPRNWCPREIAVEYCMQNSDAVDPSGLNNVPAAYNPNNVWREAARYDNLTLSADGTMVFLTGLRDTTNADGAQSWVSQRTGRDDGNGNWSQEENNAYRGDTLRKRPLRMQLAIEGDWPIVALAGRGGTKASDPNRIYDRVQNGPKFCWQVVAPPGDYVEYLRHEKSRPIGQGPISSINDFRSNIAFPTKCVEGDELFTDRVNNETGRQPEHAKARLQDVKRVEVSAQLEIQALAPCHKPGITYTLEGPNTIPVYGVARTVILRSNPQSDLQGQTTICLEPPEFEGLYNSSLGRSGSAKAPSNAGSGYASVSFSDPYADYQSKTPQQQTSTPPQTSGSDSGYAYGGTANAALAGAMGGAGAGKQVSNKAAEGRAGNAQRAKNAASMAADARKAGNIEQAEKHEKAARKLAANAENFEQNKAGKEEQRANRGSFTTADGRTMKAGDNFMGGGRNTAGSMTYANGQRVEAGELDKNAAGMINTQAVDKYIENQPRRKEGLSGNGGKALATPEERAAAGMSVGNRGSMSKTGKANTPAISIGASPRPKATGETRAQKFAREQAETFARANQPDKPLFNTKAPDRSAAKAREQMEADMEGGQKL
ncbi:MAG TPA: hypothetical protein VEK08_18585 [Planctomycetota bacterium]|nr:hypothetical protein [Planctomycetota bacterium]